VGILTRGSIHFKILNTTNLADIEKVELVPDDNENRKTEVGCDPKVVEGERCEQEPESMRRPTSRAIVRTHQGTRDGETRISPIDIHFDDLDAPFGIRDVEVELREESGSVKVWSLIRYTDGSGINQTRIGEERRGS
jgi:hypothetical protein